MTEKGTPTKSPVTRQLTVMIAVIGITGIKYLRMKSRGFKGDMNKRVRKDELFFWL